MIILPPSDHPCCGRGFLTLTRAAHMTTAFYDPITNALYSDSQTCMGAMRYSTAVRKITLVPHPDLGTCIAVGAGARCYVDAVFEAISVEKAMPNIPSDEHVSIMLLTADGKMYEASSPDMYLAATADSSAFNAIGSGTPFAHAAYLATGCPVKTMDIVKQLDIYSGGATVKGYFDKSGYPVIEDLTS